MIGLTTIHYANSYGGLLQTYASVNKLLDYGKVCLLDYRKPVLADGLRPIRWKLKEPRDILRIGKDLIRYPDRSVLIKKFGRFIAEHFPLSPTFTSHQQAGAVVEGLGIKHLISGSDQIWNPSITGGFDEVFTLNFDASSIRSSLSTSAGSYKYSKDEGLRLARALDQFENIAVREPDFANYLQEILPGRVINTTLDPTLLLNKERWRKLCAKPLRLPFDRYLLTYTLGSPPGFQSLLESYRKKFGLPIVSINQDPFISHKADIHIKNAGPEEFLSLFNGADSVITNSFHGVAFSINFEKQFYAFPPSSGVNRIANLLKATGTSNRLLPLERQARWGFVEEDIDYSSVTPALDRERELSLSYIDRILKVS